MQKLNGQCDCGQTKIAVTLSKPYSHFTPRKCDCDFCSSRDIAYLSDPDGNATISALTEFTLLQQGSKQAQFLACRHCDMVVAASIKTPSDLLGAINIRVFPDQTVFARPQPASPKKSVC